MTGPLQAIRVTAMRLPSRPGQLDPELDARLVERCLSGDARAWDALVRRHERLVYAVARSYRLDDEDLGDVFQDVFTALHRGLPRLRDPRTLCRWLSSTTDRIARTTALRRRREQARSVSTDEPDSGRPELVSADEAVGADLERLEAQALVRLAMAGVSERCRNLLYALYQEDPVPAYSELSERLGVPIGSLGPTRARCLEKLKGGLSILAPELAGISNRTPPTSTGEGIPPHGPAPAPGSKARTSDS